MELLYLKKTWMAVAQTSDNSTSNNTSQCPELSNNDDGHLPLIVGTNLLIALVFFTLFGIMHCYFPNFIKASYIQRRWPNLLSRAGRGIQDSRRDEQTIPPTVTHSQKSWCQNFLTFLIMGEKGVRARVGPDASLYLTMELYLLAILVVFTFLSLGIMVPINYRASDLQNSSFARTTIGNVDPTSDVLWAYNVFAAVYFLIAVAFMLHYSVRLGREQKLQSTRSVMIQDIPVFVHSEDLMQHFEEAMPGLDVVDIRFAYNVTKLTTLWEQLKEANRQLAVAESYQEERDKPLMVRIGWEKICICSDEYLVNAQEYYETEQDRLRLAVAKERAIALEDKKLNIAFVTFRLKENAEDFVNAYRTCICVCRSRPVSSLTGSIHSTWWHVSMAPVPGDMLWENLSTGWIWAWIEWTAINIALLVFVFFFSTPVVMLNSIDQLKVIFLNITNLSVSSVQPPGLIQSYLASFLLTMFSTLLLFIVTRSVYLESHWSRSRRACAMLRKGFVFLLIMVLFLPTLGFTSLSALSQLLLQENDPQHLSEELSCIYLPNNGVFFISYIVIAAFVVTPIELVRIFQFIEYLYWVVLARTKLEKKQAVKKITRYDFMFGLQYAYSLLIFALTVTYSLSTPLIVPFGTLFFLVKYYVDKYNLLYAYKPSSSSGSQYIHKTASNLVLVATLHLQLGTLLFIIVRAGYLSALGIFLIVILILSIILCCGIIFCDWFGYIRPYFHSFSKGYRIFSNSDDDDDSEVQFDCHVAPVVEDTLGECPSSSPSDDSVMVQSYESFGRTLARGKKYQVLRTAGTSRQLPKQGNRESTLVEEKEEDEANGTKED